MILRRLGGLAVAGLGLAATAPARAVDHAAGTALRAAAEATALGTRSAAQAATTAADTAVRVARVARTAVIGEAGHWRAGHRWHVPLSPRAARGDGFRVSAAARKVAAELVEHPDVVLAYWDGGLGRMVVRLGENAVTDRVTAAVERVAARHGLVTRSPERQPVEHPGDVSDVRTAAGALAADAAGLAVGLVGLVNPLPVRRWTRPAVAALTVAREAPRVRGVLRGWLGDDGADLLLAGLHAAAQGTAGAPVPLALDGALRAGQLAEALLRAAAFDAVHDRLCGPDRPSLAGDEPRPERPPTPAERYAGTAVTAGVLAAGGTLLFQRDVPGAAEVVLAGSPRAARYGPAAFTAALGCVLARDGVLVRAPDRLRLLETVDTLLLHPSALRGTTRAVLEVHPSSADWDRTRLWQAATAALHGDPAAPVRLRPVPDHPSAESGLMIATEEGGADVGTVHVGWEPDPLAEPVLEAARRAGLRVLLTADPSVTELAGLADEVVSSSAALPDLVAEQREQGRVVLTLARLDPDDAALRDALLRSDLAVTIVDGLGAVLWPADVLCPRGLAGAWRLLTAVPEARNAAQRAKVLAESGAALASLLMTTGSSARWRHPVAYRLRLSPVDFAAAAALVSGWWSALRTARPVPATRVRVQWHALPPGQVLRRLRPDGGPTALSDVVERVRATARVVWRHPTAAPVRLPVQLADAIRAELHDPLTPVLAVGAAASAILGSTVDALLVTGAIAINAAVGGVQRVRAERALAALATGQRRRARRVTDGATATVDAAVLSPGDVVELDVGDVVPADARLLEVADLEVDESSLTGESLPVAKQVAATPDAALPDRRCMVFEGTTVVAGRARAVVVVTGEQTAASRAVALATRTPPAVGVQARLHELTSRALPMALLGGGAVAVLSLLRGRTVRQAVSGGVSVAVAAVPEGLPLVATVAQMAAARRLSTRGVLVRAPRALEALGRTDTVCFDKTGTLTENALHVVSVTTPDTRRHDPNAPAATPVLRDAARACPREAGDPTRHAHATDEAVLSAAGPGDDWTQLDGLPFEASRGYAAATGSVDGRQRLVVKGAPEVVLPCCAEVTDELRSACDALTADGLRVLAVAHRPLSTADGSSADQALGRLRLAGFVALADTPRASAEPLVTQLRAAGVNPVMLTGDHPRTAQAIARRLGWPEDTEVVTGDELAALDRTGRARALRDAGVVARVAPEQKLQVVEALRAAGRSVAMVGDGANDAAAIRAADVGVGIAARGSAAARNAADVVLTRDELTVLIDAVTEGRALWGSVADAISILIGGNAGEVGFTVLGTLIGGASPFSTRQLLLVNLLTDMFPAMAVAVTPSDADSTDQHATAVGGTALGEPLLRQIRRRGITTAVGAGTAWTIGRLTPGTARRTSTMALCGLVGAQLTQTLVGRWRSPLVLATAVGSAAVLASLVQTPGISHFFGCTPLGPVACAGVAASIGTSLISHYAMPSLERVADRSTRRFRPGSRSSRAR